MANIVSIGCEEILDEKIVRELKEEGFVVWSVSDPATGRTVCKGCNPILIFIDMTAAGSDGFTLLEAVRKETSPNAVIVTVCRDYTQPLHDYCERRGANFVLPAIDHWDNFGLFVYSLLSLAPQETFAA